MGFPGSETLKVCQCVRVANIPITTTVPASVRCVHRDYTLYIFLFVKARPGFQACEHKRCDHTQTRLTLRSTTTHEQLVYCTGQVAEPATACAVGPGRAAPLRCLLLLLLGPATCLHCWAWRGTRHAVCEFGRISLSVTSFVFCRLAKRATPPVTRHS